MFDIEVSQCSNCASQALAPVNWHWKFALAMFFILPFPMPYTRNLVKCMKCFQTTLNIEKRGYPLYVLFVYILFLNLFIFVSYEFMGALVTSTL